MVDGLSKIVATFVAVLLLFIYPLSHMADNQEESMKLLVLSATTQLVDGIRDKGYLDLEMYDGFLETLAITGCTYEVALTHRHKSFYPIYTDVLDPATFTGDYEAYYEGFFTEEILSGLNSSGIYYLSKDDYVLIEVYNTSKTFAAKVKTFIIGDSIPARSIYVQYGGQVRYENY